MPHPLMNSAVSFGLVTIPVSVWPATESHSIAFRQIHTADGGRIRNRKICEQCGEQLSQDQIGRGYEAPDGSLVEITDADLDGLPLESVRAIEVIGFNAYESIDAVSIGRAYYLAAHGDIAAKPYSLIVKALQRTSKAAVVRYSLRDRERLGLLRVKDNVLVLHQLLAADEIRDSAALAPPEESLPEHEIQSALALAEALSSDDIGDVGDLTDHYTEALEKIIAAKADGRQLSPAESGDEGQRAPIVDLMAALSESVEKAREARGEPAAVHEMPTRNRAAKKTTSAAKRSSAKKTAGKKKAGGHIPHKSA
ncbi:Ku protein [Streptomyces sp. NBC_01142]|uniref:non-homologous end joining protein Ku n=1 Tax=Streptomyces sp. NBC_01142 TaxID=2975865 RepID=UPI0022540B54|nr:Ku protein [Streptomyces sp. NBC_01142]MCX4826166.1 Ku protein [Streptomyces sp. NBC_01142]